LAGIRSFTGNHLQKSWVLKIPYLVSLFGCFLDQLTTRIGLTNPSLYEMNPIASAMMEQGIWLYVDVSIVIVSIVVTYFILKKWTFEFKRVILLYPFSLGLLKTLAGIHNLALYLMI
jgi:hypothetical protein